MEKNYKKSTERRNKRKDYMKLPLIELLSLVASKAEDPSTSDRALLALIERVNPFLRSKTHYFCSIYRIYSTLEEQEVVSSITLTMYQDIRQLLETIKNHTEEQHMQAMEEWLSKSIQQIVKEKEGRKKKEIKIIYDDLESYSADTEESDEAHAEETSRKILVQKAILKQASSRITPKNYKILLTYYQYKEGRKKLPPEILKQISSEFNITNHYAAKIHRRSFDTIYKGCQQLACKKAMAASLPLGRKRE